MTIGYCILAALTGLILGSFFNVLIYRIPKNISIVWPPSSCPHCAHKIAPWENIPILGYLLLAGKCSKCSSPISWIYPGIELITGIASLVLWQWYLAPQILINAHEPWWSMVPTFFTALALLLLIPIAVIDIRHFIIPDAFTVPGSIIAIAISFIPGGSTPLAMILGLIAGSGALFLTGLIGGMLLKKEAMGGGDVKLMAFYGALIGWKLSLISIFESAIAGSIAGIILMIAHGKSGRTHEDRQIPYGPFLAIGIWGSFFFGERLLMWYMSLFGA